MANDTPITVIGGLTADPTDRTRGEQPFVTFSLASTPRFFKDGEWRDGETAYWDCSVSGPLAASVLGEYRKGSQVIAVGTIVARSWEDPQSGAKRHALTLRVTDIGTKLGRSTSRDRRSDHSSGAGAGYAPGQNAATTDAWSTPQQADYGDETPF